MGIARFLFFLNTIIWLALAVYSLLRVAASSGRPANHNPVMILIVILMVGNAAAMLAAGFAISRRIPIFYFFALLILAINILLTFTDQFGVLDFITLLIDLILFFLLLTAKREFTGSQSELP